MILLCKALYRAFAVFVQSSLQVVCHAGVQDSISFVGQKVDIILFHILTAFLGVEFAEAFLLSERVLRDCHVASLLAMTNRRCVPFLRWLVPNGSAFPRLPRLLRSLAMTSLGAFSHSEGRKGKPESASLPCHSEERSDVGISSRHLRFRRGFLVFRACTARLPRRFAPRNDKSGGQHCFNGGRYGSGVPSRDCHVASLLAMTNRRCVPSLRWLVLNGSTYLRLPRRFAPRNDKSGGRYDQLNLPRILRFPPYWKSPQRR